MKIAAVFARWHLVFLTATFGVTVLAPPSFGQDEIIDSVIYLDPKLPVASLERVFPVRLIALWLQALERPENDLKCQAANAIGLARRRGMTGLEATVAPLLHALDQPGQHPTVRLALAQALIALDARQAAPQLFAHSRADGIDMRDLVEPCLARWDYVPVRPVWLERLNQPTSTGRGILLAIQGLGMVKETKAAGNLRSRVLDPKADPIIRLEAGRALAGLASKGLELDATRLADERSGSAALSQLVAATILMNHKGEASAKILQKLAVEAELGSAAVALQGLLNDDPRLIAPLMPRILASRDAKVRSLGVEAFRRNPLNDQVTAIANMMDDPNTLVRVGARKALAEVAPKAGFGEAIRAQAIRLLAGTQWRALEQSALLLTVLDNKSAAPRLVELLQFNRPEVFVAAAWGLRKLAVPATLPGQLKEVERRLNGARHPIPGYPHDMIDRELVQLNQSLGIARHAPAASVLARFVAKSTPTGPESRSAAIWALGLIHEKEAPEDLVRQLLERLADDGMDAEDPKVRGMSAISLGRMKAPYADGVLRRYYTGELTLGIFPSQCGWALEQITGKKMATSGVVKAVQKGWFLEPIE